MALDGWGRAGQFPSCRQSGNWDRSLNKFRIARHLGQIHFERHTAEEKGGGKIGKKNLTYSYMGI